MSQGNQESQESQESQELTEPACRAVVVVWQQGRLTAAPGATTREAGTTVTHLEMAHCWLGSLGAGCQCGTEGHHKTLSRVVARHLPLETTVCLRQVMIDSCWHVYC